MIKSDSSLLYIEMKKLFAMSKLEAAINSVFQDAISSSNIDGNVIDECYKEFGEGLAHYAMNFLKDFFFDAVIEKNAIFVSKLKKEIADMTDNIIVKINDGDIDQVEAEVNRIVDLAEDRSIYGNIDNFLVVNIDNALNMLRWEKNIALDEEKVQNVLFNIRTMVQMLIVTMMDGNKKAIDTIITNYVNELMKMAKDVISESKEDGELIGPFEQDRVPGFLEGALEKPEEAPSENPGEPGFRF